MLRRGFLRSVVWTPLLLPESAKEAFAQSAGLKIAYNTVCCLHKAWSVLDLALVVSGFPSTTALALIDQACKLGFKDKRDRPGKKYVVYKKNTKDGVYIGRTSGRQRDQNRWTAESQPPRCG